MRRGSWDRLRQQAVHAVEDEFDGRKLGAVLQSRRRTVTQQLAADRADRESDAQGIAPHELVVQRHEVRADRGTYTLVAEPRYDAFGGVDDAGQERLDLRGWCERRAARYSTQVRRRIASAVVKKISVRRR